MSDLVETTKGLNSEIEKFVEEYRINTEIKNIDATNSGDQRHFFAFPDSEQFRCSIPRPAGNLIFENGKLSPYIEEEKAIVVPKT